MCVAIDNYIASPARIDNAPRRRRILSNDYFGHNMFSILPSALFILPHEIMGCLFQLLFEAIGELILRPLEPEATSEKFPVRRYFVSSLFWILVLFGIWWLVG